MTRWLAVVALAVGLSACGSAPRSSDDDGRLLVVTTTTQVSDFARNIGGDRVDVHPLLKANVDPHDFEASAADLVALGRADVIVENGVGLEGWLSSTMRSADPTGSFVDASTGVTVREGDPHIWTDPANAEIMATNIADGVHRGRPGRRGRVRREPRRVHRRARRARCRDQLPDRRSGRQAARHRPRLARLLRRSLRTGPRRFGDPQLRQPGGAVADRRPRPRRQHQGAGREGDLHRGIAVAEGRGGDRPGGRGEGRRRRRRAVRRQSRPAGQRRRHLREDDGAQHPSDRRRPCAETSWRA